MVRVVVKLSVIFTGILNFQILSVIITICKKKVFSSKVLHFAIEVEGELEAKGERCGAEAGFEGGFPIVAAIKKVGVQLVVLEVWEIVSVIGHFLF